MASALSAKQPELSRLKGVLKAKQAELLSGLGNREGIAIESAADDFDKIQYAAERDITIAKLHLDSTLLWWTPFFGQKKTSSLDRAAALKMKESQCLKFARVTHPA